MRVDYWAESFASEDALCKAFVKTLLQYENAELIAQGTIWFHIPNELPRPTNNDPKIYAILGAKLKAMGRKRGVPDYAFHWRDAFGVSQAGFLEAKMQGKNPSVEQEEFLENCQSIGVRTGVFRSVQEGLRFLQDWGIIKKEVWA